jgi:hypothetical protein
LPVLQLSGRYVSPVKRHKVNHFVNNHQIIDVLFQKVLKKISVEIIVLSKNNTIFAFRKPQQPRSWGEILLMNMFN